MQREQVRQVVSAQFYQSLSDSNIQVKSIPPQELQSIVNALADGVFAALAAVEDQALNAPRPAATRGPVPTPGVPGTQSAEPHIEELIWRGRPYLSIGTIYELTTQRLRVIHGIFGNQIDEIELIRVHDTKVKQNVGERAFDIGDISVFADDSTTPLVMLNNVGDPIQVREKIRTAVLEERQRRGLVYREVMQ